MIFVYFRRHLISLLLYLWLATGGLGFENGNPVHYAVFVILATSTLVVSTPTVRVKIVNLVIAIVTTTLLFYSLPFSTNINNTFGKLDGLVISGLFIFFTLSAVSRYDQEFVVTFINVGLLILFITIIFKLNTGFWSRPERYFLNGSIVFGWLMGLMAVFALNFYIKTDKKKYLFYWLVFTIAVVWSFSKGPLLSVVIVSALSMIIAQRFKLIFVTIVVIFIIYFLLFYLEIQVAPNRLFAILRVISGETNQADAGSVGNRIMQWRHAIKLIESYPFFGAGIGNFSLNLAGYNSPYPHNIILELLSEHGIFTSTVILFIVLVSLHPFKWEYMSLFLFLLICMSFSGDAAYWRFILFVIILRKFNILERKCF